MMSETSQNNPEVRYVPVEIIQSADTDSEEIDLLDLIQTIYDGRWLVLKIVAAFVALGLFFAFTAVEEFTSEVKVLPESQQSSPLGSLGGLARQFGFSSGPVESSGGIPARMYPSITQNTVFLVNLLDHPITLEETEQELTIREYLQEHQKRPVGYYMRRYTIGLPSVLISKLRSSGNENSEEVTNISGLGGDTFASSHEKETIRLSNRDWGTVRQLRSRIESIADSETGIVTISVKMQDPVVAAEIARLAVRQLSEYVTRYRTEKSQRDVEFIQERLEDAKGNFEDIQQELARFTDANRGQLTAVARIQEQQLQSRYNLTFNLYNTMAERLEEAQIKLQEDTPVVNITEPPAVPDRNSEPNRLFIIIVFVMLGTILAVGTIFVLKIYQDIRQRMQAAGDVHAANN